MAIVTGPAPAPQAVRRPVATRSAPAIAGRAGDERVVAGPAGLAKLTAPDRAAYAAVAAQLDAPGRAHLARLLASGTLTQADAKGSSLIANLAALGRVKPPGGAPYTATDLLRQALAHVAEPAVINQGDRWTCGATTVQYVLASEAASEYVRLVAGLAGEGRVALRGGQTMTRVADSVARDTTTRDDVERLVQSAFQDYGDDFRGRYANQTDTIAHANGDQGGIGGFFRKTVGRAVDWVVGQAGGQLGISEGKIHRLYQDTTGRKARLVGDLPGGAFLAPGPLRGDTWAAVAQAVAAGQRVPVDLITDGLADKPGAQQEHLFAQALGNYPTQMRSHQVLVTRIEGGRVHYRNPWGYETSLSVAEFRSRLTDAIIPQ